MLRYRKDSATPKGQFVYSGKNVTPEQVEKLFNRMMQKVKFEVARLEELQNRIKELEEDRELLTAAVTISENSLSNALERLKEK